MKDVWEDRIMRRWRRVQSLSALWARKPLTVFTSGLCFVWCILLVYLLYITAFYPVYQQYIVITINVVGGGWPRGCNAMPWNLFHWVWDNGLNTTIYGRTSIPICAMNIAVSKKDFWLSLICWSMMTEWFLLWELMRIVGNRNSGNTSKRWNWILSLQIGWITSMLSMYHYLMYKHIINIEYTLNKQIIYPESWFDILEYWEEGGRSKLEVDWSRTWKHASIYGRKMGERTVSERMCGMWHWYYVIVNSCFSFFEMSGKSLDIVIIYAI